MLKQLSGLDSMFLYSENSRMPLEVSSLHIYDPSTAPNGVVRFKEILATFSNRIEQAGIFHRKIFELPFSMDNPYWVEDEDFDIEYHVRHIALPKPGDWRQLMIQISRLQSRELDKSRPLWEAYVIEGLDHIGRLPRGCFAVFLKMHHSTVDGVSGAALQAAIHDIEPIQVDASDYTPGFRSHADSTPNTAALMAKGIVNNMNKSVKLLVGLGGAVPRLIKAKKAQSDTEKAEIPSTVFNSGRVSANRVIDGRLFDLKTVKEIAKSEPGAKVNDVALAIVSGAMRRYLESKDELPVESLIAACPINVRKEDSGDVDNMVSMMNTTLYTDTADPLLRLRAIVQGTRKAKEFTEILGADTLTTIPMNLPAFIASSVMRPLMNLAIRFDAVSFNTMISNVAGFQKPLYFCGAKMIAMYGMGPVVDQAGLFHAVFSYDGKITVTFTACREMLPDPEFYADCIQSSFEELEKAALKPKTKAGVKASKKKAAKKKGAKKKGAKKKGVRKKSTTDGAAPKKAVRRKTSKGIKDVGQRTA